MTDSKEIAKRYDPNRFVKNPSHRLGPVSAVHIVVEDDAIARESNAGLAFYLRLKATPGCTSKNNLSMCITNLYIEPNSEAAKLFVSRMMATYRGLPEGSQPPALAEKMRKLTSEESPAPNTPVEDVRQVKGQNPGIIVMDVPRRGKALRGGEWNETPELREKVQKLIGVGHKS